MNCDIGAILLDSTECDYESQISETDQWSVPQFYGLGQSVAVFDNDSTIAVGRPNVWPDPNGASEADGDAALFNWDFVSTWRLVSSMRQDLIDIAAPPPTPGSEFGNSVSAGGTTLAIGSAGQVYFSDQGGGTNASPLTSPYHITNAAFGWQVAFSADGNWLIVSDPLDSSNSKRVNDLGNANVLGPAEGGAVFVYTYPALKLTAYVKAPLPLARAHFGCAIAVNHDATIVAIGECNNDGMSTGAFYVLRDRNGLLLGPFEATNHQANANFGSALAVTFSGQYIAVGANGEPSALPGHPGPGSVDHRATAAGAFYIFDQNGAQIDFVKADAVFDHTWFGTSLAFSDESVLIVGAPGDGLRPGAPSFGPMNGMPDPNPGQRAGAAYIYDCTPVCKTRSVIVGSSVVGSLFGESVAVTHHAGTTFVIGAPSSTATPPMGGLESTGYVEIVSTIDNNVPM